LKKNNGGLLFKSGHMQYGALRTVNLYCKNLYEIKFVSILSGMLKQKIFSLTVLMVIQNIFIV